MIQFMSAYCDFYQHWGSRGTYSWFCWENPPKTTKKPTPNL